MSTTSKCSNGGGLSSTNQACLLGMEENEMSCYWSRAFRFQEIPEIAAKRKISSLSTRNKERRMQEIEDVKRAADWGRHAEVLLEKER